MRGTVKKSYLIGLASLAGLLGAAGCARESVDDMPPDAGLNTAKKPAFHRIVNLSGHGARFKVSGQSDIDIPSGESSLYRLIAPKPAKLTADLGGKKIEVPLELASAERQLIVVGEGGKTFVVRNEPDESPKDGSVVRLVNATSKPASVKVEGQTLEAEPGTGSTATITVPEGSHDVVAAPPIEDGSWQSVAGRTYTIFLHDRGGKTAAMFFWNNEKPRAAGDAAASGAG